MIGMPNKEKVIKGLECCSKGAVTPYVATCRFCADCPYGENDIPCTRELARDALALLKEQEAEQPIVHENSYGWKFYYCPKCKQEFYQNRKQAYCDKCGKAVKWDE